MSGRMAKYHTMVYPMNLHSSYGTPVVVYAESAQGAVDRAIEIGWNGRRGDARVRIESVEDIDPRVCQHDTGERTEGDEQ